MNDHDGRGRNHHLDAVNWTFHPNDPNIDLAVVEFEPPEWADYAAIGPKQFLSISKLRSKNTGAGDLAYVVGVFSPVHGESRNMPAVHTGHIALMPEDEPIPVIDWRDPSEQNVISVNGARPR